jgi:isopenicillin N synthase-like dioxygenase
VTIGTFDLAAFEAAVGSDRTARAATLDQMCRNTGFVVLSGHGIAPDVVGNMWSAMQSFFAQDVAAKQAVAPAPPGAPYGYLGPNQEALARSKGVQTPPDLKESFNGRAYVLNAQSAAPIDKAIALATTPWPDLPGFKDAWVAYYGAVEDLATRVMIAFAEALNLSPDYFAAFNTAPASAMRALHYPATTGTPETNQQRAGAHTDYGALTILLPQSRSQGLQVMQNDEWVDVTAPADTFVINIGDLMARWTADRWVSTLHRVVAKPDQPKRLSLAYFHQPDWNAVIAPLDGSTTYPPITFGQYLMGKFKAASGGTS